MLGTWADHIIIQAVANTIGLRIHITESAQNFSESTVVSSVYAESGGNVRDIYIGHLDELHYVSTAPTTQSVFQQVENQKDNKLQTKSKKLQISQTKSRTDYMREYMKEKRKHEKFRKKENERKREYNKTYRILNPVKVKESLKKATGTYRQSNSDKVKQKKITYRKSNPEKTKDSFKKAFATYRLSNLEKSRESSKNSSKRCNQNYPERVKDVQKRNYLKRKLADNETRVSKRPYQFNDRIACETPLQVENNYAEVRSPTTIAQLTKRFMATLVLDQNIFVLVAINCGIGHL